MATVLGDYCEQSPGSKNSVRTGFGQGSSVLGPVRPPGPAGPTFTCPGICSTATPKISPPIQVLLTIFTIIFYYFTSNTQYSILLSLHRFPLLASRYLLPTYLTNYSFITTSDVGVWQARSMQASIFITL
jgi:hypothetical protein